MHQNDQNNNKKSVKIKLKIEQTRLQPITDFSRSGNSQNFSINTNLKLFNSNGKSGILFALEYCRIKQSNTQNIETIHDSGLRKIRSIFWPNILTSKNLHYVCKCRSISTQKKKQRRFRWLGHVLRMPSDSENYFALGTTRETKALTPLRRTIQTESQDQGKSGDRLSTCQRTRTNGGSLLVPYVQLDIM